MTPVPLAIGQLRRDPTSPGNPPRIVRIVEIGVPSAYYAVPGASVRVERVCTGNVGRRSRVRVDRLERWPVVHTAWIVVAPGMPRSPRGWPIRHQLHGPCTEEEARVYVALHGPGLEAVQVAMPDLTTGDVWMREVTP